MPLLDQIRETTLIELAKTRFDPDLKPAELKVLHDSASSEDLPDPDKDAPRPEVRATFLRWLATDLEAAPHIDPKGLRVVAATIPGILDLDECLVHCSLVFDCCGFQEKINLQSAETRGIYFFDSSLAQGIHADGAMVRGPFFLRGTSSSGEVRFIAAQIASDLDCSGAKLTVKDDALSVHGARISGCFFMTQKDDQLFESSGTISLVNSEINGNLELTGAKVAKVFCKNMTVKRDLIWQRILISKDTTLNLDGAKIKNLRDDYKSWPLEGNLDIDGLIYEDLKLHKEQTKEDIKLDKLADELPLVPRERIAWIMLQKLERRIEPQPWMQLRNLLDRKGDHKGAKYVLRRFRCLQAKNRWLLRCWWSYFFAWLEEAPARILCFIAATLLLGWLVFGYAGARGAIAPTEPEAYKAFISGKPMPAAYPTLNPFVYTLENAVPLVKLGQDDKWAPDRRYTGTNWFTNYWFLMWSRWLLILSGWVQATVLAAALSGRFKP